MALKLICKRFANTEFVSNTARVLLPSGGSWWVMVGHGGSWWAQPPWWRWWLRGKPWRSKATSRFGNPERKPWWMQWCSDAVMQWCSDAVQMYLVNINIVNREHWNHWNQDFPWFSLIIRTYRGYIGYTSCYTCYMPLRLLEQPPMPPVPPVTWRWQGDHSCDFEQWLSTLLQGCSVAFAGQKGTKVWRIELNYQRISAKTRRFAHPKKTAMTTRFKAKENSKQRPLESSSVLDISPHEQWPPPSWSILAPWNQLKQLNQFFTSSPHL